MLREGAGAMLKIGGRALFHYPGVAQDDHTIGLAGELETM
jgi:hypothetical protein